MSNNLEGECRVTQEYQVLRGENRVTIPAEDLQAEDIVEVIINSFDGPLSLEVLLPTLETAILVANDMTDLIDVLAVMNNAQILKLAKQIGKLLGSPQVQQFGKHPNISSINYASGSTGFSFWMELFSKISAGGKIHAFANREDALHKINTVFRPGRHKVK